MFRIIPLFLVLILFGGALLPAVLLADMQSANYVIWADAFDSGGSEDDTSANFRLSDSIGEGLILSATSTSANFGIKAGFREMYPTDYLTFTVSTGAINFGTLSSSAVTSASHTMNIDTNAANGFTIKVSGTTLTSGANTITAIGGAAAASAPGTEQFGINLVANTAPAVGANPAGTAPLGSPAANYNTANNFAFQSNDTIASAVAAFNATVFTVSYIANIAAGTENGTYTTNLTYAATANF